MVVVVRQGDQQTDGAAEAFPAVASIDAEPRFRAVTSKSGERRGIRLEGIYWDALARVSAETGLSLAELIDHAVNQLPDNGNLASWLRVLAVKWSISRLAHAENVASSDRLNALVQASPIPTVALTRDKRLRFFNEAFLTMLRQRLSLPNVTQLTRGLRFSVETQIADAIAVLEANPGRPLATGFSVSCGGATLRGQINIALAPDCEQQMVLGYVSRY
ncbi:ribbon-helix-helix domain-containing protein [Rhizobium helianthi]|uniref:Ribbon-helix-helix domain-containing protein n=1 Tax=Rhizobium helianthi TaxID=1132695 RepID=A0ABW4M7J5_9HYPH